METSLEEQKGAWGAMDEASKTAVREKQRAAKQRKAARKARHKLEAKAVTKAKAGAGTGTGTGPVTVQKTEKEVKKPRGGKTNKTHFEIEDGGRDGDGGGDGDVQQLRTSITSEEYFNACPFCLYRDPDLRSSSSLINIIIIID